MKASELRHLLERARLDCSTEEAMQRGVEAALITAGLLFFREVQLGKADRIDFMVAEVGVELKIKGSPHPVLRQLARYAASSRVTELLLVTSRPALCNMPASIGAKPLLVALVARGLA